MAGSSQCNFCKQSQSSYSLRLVTHTHTINTAGPCLQSIRRPYVVVLSTSQAYLPYIRIVHSSAFECVRVRSSASSSSSNTVDNLIFYHMTSYDKEEPVPFLCLCVHQGVYSAQRTNYERDFFWLKKKRKIIRCTVKSSKPEGTPVSTCPRAQGIPGHIEFNSAKAPTRQLHPKSSCPACPRVQGILGLEEFNSRHTNPSTCACGAGVSCACPRVPVCPWHFGALGIPGLVEFNSHRTNPLLVCKRISRAPNKQNKYGEIHHTCSHAPCCAYLPRPKQTRKRVCRLGVMVSSHKKTKWIWE